MRLRLQLLIPLMALTLLFAAPALAQSDPTNTPDPAPTATLSPRALVGIFQTLRVNYGLEVESDTGFASYPDVSRFMQLFAQRYLGIDPHMPYSSSIYVGFMGYDQFSRMVYFLLPESISRAFQDHVYGLFSDHFLIASVGLRKDGFALLYTERCVNPYCNTPQEHMNQSQSEAFAIYGLYVPGSVQNESGALNLIQTTFPALSTLDFSPDIAEDERYTFHGQTTTSIYDVETPLSYYVGTINIPRYTFVYAIVGVGEETSPVMMSPASQDE